MLMDLASTFSGAVAADGTRTPQAITATAISTNVLDLRQQNTPQIADEGILGTDCYLVVQVGTTAFNNLTSMTVTLETDSNSNMATANVVHYSKTIALANLGAGTTIVRVQLPSEDYKRYMAVRYTVTGTAPSQGGVYAFLANAIQRNITYPTNFTVV